MKKSFVIFTIISFLFLSTSSWAQSGLNGTPVGNTTPSTGKFTNLEATTDLTLNGQTITNFDTLDDDKVKSSATDATSGFLADELQGGTNVTVSEVDVGGNKKISIAVSDKLTTKGDVLIHDGSSETRLPVGASGQYLTSDTSNNLIWANPPEGDQLFNANVLLNAFRTSGLVSPAQPLKMVDGVVDAFNSENGVDATASTNEFYDNGADLYESTRAVGTTIPSVAFNGINDYLTISDATLGQSDGKSFTISFWQKNGLDANRNYFANSGAKIYIQNSGAGQLRFFARNTVGTVICDLKTGIDLVKVEDGWVHVFVAIDLANTTVKIAINGTVETLSVSTPPANDTIDFTNGEVGIGYTPPFSGGSVLYQGDLAQFYMVDEYIDPSVPGNLAKFIDFAGNPVDLGSDGSTPTGSQPLIFLNNTLSTWQNNLGSGGNFTENGALTAGTGLSTSGTPDNMTLLSNPQTAKAEPNGAHVVLFAEDPAADIILNTDLKASVSRDGGTTFTQVTLSDAGEFEKGNLLTGTVDISSQPTGTDMQWKVETDNNKALNLHGVGLEWR